MNETDDGTIAWRALLDEATAELEGAVDTPSVDARRIVEEVGGHEGAEFAMSLDRLVTKLEMARFDALVARRLSGEPLQYVLGRWAFRGLDLAVDRRVLIPRPETEIVVEVGLAELDRISGTRVADLGTGSGAIALSIVCERPEVVVWAVETSRDALVVARGNLAGIGRVATRVTMLEGSWFVALPTELVGTLDLIISNPPYIAADETLPPVVADWEPRSALVAGPSGTEQLAHLIDGAAAWLSPRGTLVLELAPHQAQWARQRADRAGYSDVSAHSDLAGRDRVLVARR